MFFINGDTIIRDKDDDPIHYKPSKNGISHPKYAFTLLETNKTYVSFNFTNGGHDIDVLFSA